MNLEAAFKKANLGVDSKGTEFIQPWCYDTKDSSEKKREQTVMDLADSSCRNMFSAVVAKLSLNMASGSIPKSTHFVLQQRPYLPDLSQ